MNVLFLAPRLPWPADTGGKIRALNILKQIHNFAKVHLVCFAFERSDQEGAAQLQKLGVEVTLVPAQEISFIAKIMRALFHPIPVSVQKYDLPHMHSALLKILKTHRFNAIHIDHAHMSCYGIHFKGLACVLDEHNVEYRILERCAHVEQSLIKKALYAAQARKMKLFEIKHVQTMAGYCAVSEDDRLLLRDLTDGQPPGWLIPNGVDTEYFYPVPISALTPEQSLVFTGSMDWVPNEDAMVFFCKDILPLIWKMKPKVKLYIVGRDPSRVVRELALRQDRIVVTGRVDDVRPLVAGAAVFVVPLRIGGGTRLKILEAMAMQKAVVSTTIGAEGIGFTPDQNILLADTPQDFANKTLSLLGDTQMARRLGVSARHLVCSQYDWNIIGKKLKTIYQGISGVV